MTSPKTIKVNPWDLDKHPSWRKFLEEKAERLKKRKRQAQDRGNRGGGHGHSHGR